MKQNFTRFIFAALLPLAAYGQTIVSTTAENKKIILEEFTGINCVYCPQGHAIAKAIQDNNPGNVFLINIHQGGFATPQGSQPDFRTSFGNGIVNQSYSGGGFGYPSGTVNRHVFPGREMTADGTTALDRGQWTAAANELLTENSYVNVALESSIDSQSRIMTITAEIYYTGNSPVSTNKLNIALLQNNTFGPQTGGGQGNNYNHMHRLIHMVTGQWGEEITTTSQGNFVQKTYTYTIPESHNNIPIVFGDLELVAFIAEGQQEIISGNGTSPAYTNLPLNNDMSIKSIREITPQCSGMAYPVIEIKNNGNNVLTTLDITYSINSGAPQVYTWTGSLGGLQYETVTLPGILYTQDENVLQISIPSDEDDSNNVGTINFNEAVQTSNNLILSVRTDNWGDECSWEILDSAGTVVYEGGPYNGQNNQTFTFDLALPGECYTFKLYDAFGDGGGAVSLKDSNNVVVYSTTGAYGAGASVNFSTEGVMGVSDLTASNVQIYPNPSTGIINVEAKNASSIDVYDVTGKRVYSTSNVSQTTAINLSAYGKGIFVVKISEGKNVTTKKVVIK
ncbi:T9SS type A sorting domain-containing protein [Moheibacter sediminis]|uniref:Por secretion system C-terminal sorting domain-containing protein n=1 Tax=Moheibacter sediminis TaxID=1434700 RepID=A0A1W2CGR3_9FLAO|nr:Omp28-related outer membrane protein [Moheibacter sediminis]SMC84403.1 Por secretion system C-terminal sorting domain-containing protein [Moheibacter sediminis]